MQNPYVRDFDANISSSGKVLGKAEKCRPKFAKAKVINFSNGDPVEKEVEVCYIEIPGDKTQRHAMRVTDEVKRRFPAEYLAWTNGDTAFIDGTPLNTLPTLPERLCLEMQASGIRTVEDLADLSDGLAKSFMQGTVWRKKAAGFLANKRPDEASLLRTEVSDLKAQMAELIATLKPAEKRGPGRPANTEKAE